MSTYTMRGQVKLAAIKTLIAMQDGPDSRHLLNTMERSGLDPTWAQTAAAALTWGQAERFDVVLVALSLPDASALDVIAWFDRTPVGILAIGAAEAEGERILALELGADDVTTSLTSPREMVARIRAIYRRAHRRLPVERAVYGDLCIDFNRGMATVAGQRLKLTAAEFAVLELLATHAGQTVSREALSETALRRPWRPDDRSVDQLVFSLRQKLPVDDDQAALIQTVRCGGYRMCHPDAIPMVRQLEGGTRMLAAVTIG